MPATYLLIAINVLVFVVMVVRGVHPFNPTPDILLDWGADFGPKTIEGEWWRMLTCQFVHAGLIHLLLNMSALYMIGQILESRIGGVTLIVVSVAAGLCGSIASLYWHPYIVSVGASGAVMGLAGAAMGFVYRPTASITAANRKQILERAWGFAGMTLLYGFKPGIDQAAHFGGFAGGLICGLILSQPLSNPWDRRWIRSSLVASVGLLAVTLAVAAPPKVVVAEKVWLQISNDESAALKDYHSLFDELDAGKITLPDFATALQSKVLRRWQEGRARFEVLLALPYGNKPLIEKYRDYFQLREESTALQIKSIQQNNENLKREAAAKSQAADELSEEISAMSADLNRAS